MSSQKRKRMGRLFTLIDGAIKLLVYETGWQPRREPSSWAWSWSNKCTIHFLGYLPPKSRMILNRVIQYENKSSVWERPYFAYYQQEWLCCVWRTICRSEIGNKVNYLLSHIPRHRMLVHTIMCLMPLVLEVTRPLLPHQKWSIPWEKILTP